MKFVSLLSLRQIAANVNLPMILAGIAFVVSIQIPFRTDNTLLKKPFAFTLNQVKILNQKLMKAKNILLSDYNDYVQSDPFEKNK